MDKNRITRPTQRTSEQRIAKSTVINDWGGKSGERAGKAVGLTSGDLQGRLEEETQQDWGGRKAARPSMQKSAEGIVGGVKLLKA